VLNVKAQGRSAEAYQVWALACHPDLLSSPLEDGSVRRMIGVARQQAPAVQCWKPIDEFMGEAQSGRVPTLCDQECGLQIRVSVRKNARQGT
jgi:hypothetical protein